MEKVWRAERTATMRLWKENEKRVDEGGSRVVSPCSPTRSSSRVYMNAG